MDWANTPWYVFVISGVVMPLVTEVLKKWKAMSQVKTALALAVSCAVAAGGLLIDGKLTWETVLPNMGVVFMTGTVVYRMFFKEGAVKGITKFIAPALLVVMSLSIVACQTTDPREAAPLLGQATEGPASGAAKSGVESAEMPMAPAVGVNSPGDVTATGVNANYRPTASNTVSGHLVTAIVASFTAEQLKELRQDAVLESIATEMKEMLESPDNPETEEVETLDTTRLDALRVMYAERSKELMESAKFGMPDFSALTSIVNLGIITGNAGATERTPTPEESANLPRLLANVVASARGETTILGPGESTESGDQ